MGKGTLGQKRCQYFLSCALVCHLHGVILKNNGNPSVKLTNEMILPSASVGLVEGWKSVKELHSLEQAEVENKGVLEEDGELDCSWVSW